MTLRPVLDNLRTLLRFVPRPRLVSAVLAFAGVGLVEGFGVFMLLPLLQLVGVTGDATTVGVANSRLTAAFALVGVKLTLVSALVVYVLIAGAQTTVTRWANILSALIEQDVVSALRRRLYAAIARTRWDYFVSHRASDFTHTLTNEIHRAGRAAFFAVELTVSLAITLVFFALAFRMSPAMTMVVAGIGGLLGVTMRGNLRGVRTAGAEVSASSRRLHSALTEHMASMKTAKSYGAVEHHIAIYGELAHEVERSQRQIVVNYSRVRQYMSLGATVGLAAIVYIAVRVVSVPTTNLLVLVYLFARLIPRLTALYERAQGLASDLPAINDVLALERRCFAEAEPQAERRDAIELRDAIRLHHVTYCYTGREDTQALQSLDLTIRASETTAIVGPSGAGKSTLVDVLLGLAVPTMGSVTIDDRPLDATHVDAWRAQIGYVPQDPMLFHETIRANLLWAKPSATERNLLDALKLASADGFVAALPKGLDTILGDRGVQLSGGERQRIALARALVRKPRVVILDEASSALDAENEHVIQRAIRDLHGRVTVVIVTHRLAAAMSADAIHVLDGGRLVESGTREALLARPSSRFRSMCVAQGLLGSDSVSAA